MKEVDDYISGFPENTKNILIKIREIIVRTAPGAVESFAYKMPSYKLKGKPLIYFAGYDNHIGLYATPSGHEAFEKELLVYKRGKGSVRFPLNQPIPYDLIERIVRYRCEEIMKKA